MQCSRVLDAEEESVVQQQVGARQGGACSMVVSWRPAACWMLTLVPEACNFTFMLIHGRCVMDAERHSWVCSSRHVLCHADWTTLALPSLFSLACVLHGLRWLWLPPAGLLCKN